MVNWNSGNRFSFGNLDAAQQTLYEDNPSVAYQQLLNWYGQGDPNFANTIFGKYILSQQNSLSNDYLTQAAQQASRLAQQKQDWQTQFTPPANQPLEWGGPDGKTYTLQTGNYYDLQGNKYNAPAYTPPEQQLTWTKYLEQNPGAAGGFANNFNQLTASQRGANPGSFSVKRNLW